MHAGIKYGNDTEGESKRRKKRSIEEIERLKCEDLIGNDEAFFLSQVKTLYQF